MPPPGNLACNPGMCPDWESNQQPFGSQSSAQSPEPHQPGLTDILIIEKSGHKDAQEENNVKTQGREHHMKAEIWEEGQVIEDIAWSNASTSSGTARIAANHQELERGMEGSSPRASRDSMALLTP